jgi:hypothetical protein
MVFTALLVGGEHGHHLSFWHFLILRVQVAISD